MKINKFFLGLLGITAMIMASCSSDDEYEWATVSGPQVFFSSDAADNYEINPQATSFNVPIFRQNTSGAQTVNLKSTVANPMYSVPASVTFNDGEAETVVPVSYDPAKIEYGRYDSLTIVINDQNITTPWGMSAYTFTAGVTDWASGVPGMQAAQPCSITMATGRALTNLRSLSIATTSSRPTSTSSRSTTGVQALSLSSTTTRQQATSAALRSLPSTTPAMAT